MPSDPVDFHCFLLPLNALRQYDLATYQENLSDNKKYLKEQQMPRIPILLIALFFLAGGIGHFAFTDFFVTAMPDYLSHHRELVIISGVFEILGAIGILIPKTRLWAGYGLIALIIAVYPANINMALHPDRYKDLSELFLYIRLPFQFIFIWFVWWAIKPDRLQRRIAKK